MEYIDESDEEWCCVCGNRPWLEGFFPCDRQGEVVEPTKPDWDGLRYVCDRCGRIIDQDSLQVVGRRPTPAV